MGEILTNVKEFIFPSKAKYVKDLEESKKKETENWRRDLWDLENAIINAQDRLREPSKKKSEKLNGRALDRSG